MTTGPGVFVVTRRTCASVLLPAETAFGVDDLALHPLALITHKELDEVGDVAGLTPAS